MKNSFSLAESNLKNIPEIEGVSAHYIDKATFSFDRNKDGKDSNIGKWSIKSVVPEDEGKVTKITESLVARVLIQEKFSVEIQHNGIEAENFWIQNHANIDCVQKKNQ